MYDYCHRLIYLSEDRLYKYSLKCEPRDTQDQQVRLVEKWNLEGRHRIVGKLLVNNLA